MKRLSAPITALVVLLLTTFVWADALPSAKPEQVGLSSERLARVTQVLKAEIAKGQDPGAVVLVAGKGRTASFEGLGRRDAAAGATSARPSRSSGWQRCHWPISPGPPGSTASRRTCWAV